MKPLLSILALALVAFGTWSVATATESAAETKIQIVAFHSDNCGSCKILAPKMKQAMSAVNKSRIEKVKFDLTNEETKAESLARAKAKGLEDIYNSYAPKTGMVLILDKDGKEAVKITKEDSAEDIAHKLASAIVNAS